MGYIKSNIVLIGMPGAGKSTVGVILAKELARNFVDTDILIEISQERTLQDILDSEGYLALRQIEEDVLLGVNVKNTVIATGGSAAYSHAAMTHLETEGIIIFLKISLETVYQRVHNFGSRGIAKRLDQSIQELFQERSILYRRYADITIDCNDLTHDETCGQIIDDLTHFGIR
jgi:shikimate kinase